MERKWLWAGLFALGSILGYRLKGAFAPFFLALLLALFLKPAVDFLEREKKAPRASAILLCYLVLGLLVALFFLLALPKILAELEVGVQELPRELALAEEFLGRILAKVRWQLPKALTGALDESLRRFERSAVGLIKRGLDFFAGLFLALPSLILVPIIAFYLLRDWRQLRTSFLYMLPIPLRREMLLLGAEIGQVLIGFIRGVALVCLLVGTMAAIGLYLLKVPFALTLGLVIGVLDFIPFLGPVLGGLPAVLLAFTHSPLKAVYVILLMILINQIEGGLISPRIMGAQVGLHPLLIMFSLLAAGELFGIWGLVVAVPLAAVLKVCSKFIWRRFRS